MGDRSKERSWEMSYWAVFITQENRLMAQTSVVTVEFVRNDQILDVP